MRNLDNIEKSAFRRGEYVGYSGGHVWHIRKVGPTRWRAHNRDDATARPIEAETLTALAGALLLWDVRARQATARI